MSRSVEQRWQRAQAYLERREPAPARAQLEVLRAEAPRDVRTHLLASQIAWRDDRVREAARHALEAFQVVPDDPGLLCGTIEALLQVGEMVAARACLARPPLAAAPTAALCVRLADYTQQLNENIASLAWLERAIAAGANDPETRFHYGAQLYFHGRFEDADAALEECLRAMPEHGRAAFTRAALRTQTPESNHLAELETGLARVATGSIDHAALEFARYKELEDLGRYDSAWNALATANAVMHARNPFDVDAQIAALDRLVGPRDVPWSRKSSAEPEGPQPIFILGLPRSGTTVLERMLGNHSRVESAGELPDFGAQLQWWADTHRVRSDEFIARLATIDFAELGRRYLAQTQWRAHGRSFYIDKQPPNWELAGLIHAAIPQARILHLIRDPMGVCFSNWRVFFGDKYKYSYDLVSLASYHQAYRRLMAHWHRLMPGAILDVPYAELVRDPEAAMRKVIAFCGLEWEPGCVDMRNNPVPTMTPSAAEVRGEMDTSMSARWRHYATELAPLGAMLASGSTDT